MKQIRLKAAVEVHLPELLVATSSKLLGLFNGVRQHVTMCLRHTDVQETCDGRKDAEHKRRQWLPD